jgi:hypothetical protein
VAALQGPLGQGFGLDLERFCQLDPGVAPETHVGVHLVAGDRAARHATEETERGRGKSDMSLWRRIVLLVVAASVMAFMSAPAAWAGGNYDDGKDKEHHAKKDDDHKDKHAKKGDGPGPLGDDDKDKDKHAKKDKKDKKDKDGGPGGF